MSRFGFLFFTLLCLSLPVAAQQRPTRRYDNTDAKYTVLVKELPPAPVKEAPPVKPTAANKAEAIKGNRLSKYKPFNYELSRQITTTSIKPLDLFTTGNAAVDGYIKDSGIRNGVDPVLIYAIMHQESAFKPRAVSNKGARGLMQLMPGTASRFGVGNIFDPRQNIEGGAKYMRFLLDSFDGDVSLALAGYNAGEGAVLRYGRQVPPYRETQEYVRRIAARYTLLRDPLAAKTARQVTTKQLAALQAEPAIPPTFYEQKVFAVRLPDGKLQLVRQ